MNTSRQQSSTVAVSRQAAPRKSQAAGRASTVTSAFSVSPKTALPQSPEPKRRGRKPTGVTKCRVTLTLDKALLPLIRRIASHNGGLSRLVNGLLEAQVHTTAPSATSTTSLTKEPLTLPLPTKPSMCHPTFSALSIPQTGAKFRGEPIVTVVNQPRRTQVCPTHLSQVRKNHTVNLEEQQLNTLTS